MPECIESFCLSTLELEVGQMADDVLKLLGRRIRDLRKERGLTQEQLAELAGFNYTYIGAVERAESNITTLNLQKIAEALSVSVYDLFEYTKVKRASTGKSQDIDEIIKILLSLNGKEIKKAKNILREFFTE